MTINNSTIQKLTTQELNDLDCFSTLGIGLYKGNLKSRVKIQNGYYKRNTICDGVETFELDKWEAHFIRLADVDEVPHWAFRIWDNEKNQYIPLWNLMTALTFIK